MGLRAALFLLMVPPTEFTDRLVVLRDVGIGPCLLFLKGQGWLRAGLVVSGRGVSGFSSWVQRA